MRTDFLPFALPSITEADVEEVADVVRSGWLTSGPRARKLELEVMAELRAAGALATASGTGAMAVALAVLAPPRGSWIVTTPMTFCSTAHAIEQAGCRPWFVDVEADTLNLDPEKVQAALDDESHDVGAVLPVHYGGHPVELDQVVRAARGRRVPVLEDAAHAFGAEFRGRLIGAVGPEETDRAVAFSLYATKNITGAEGGLLTASETLTREGRLWSLHGMSRDSWQRYGPRGSWDYEVVVAGFKENMSDLHAALALSQLRRWRELQERRSEIARLYSALLADVDEVELPVERPHVTHAWHLYPIKLRLDRLTRSRAEIIDALRERNVGTSVHFIPLHLQPYYRDRYDLRPDDLPIASAAFQRLVSLPIYPRMTDADVESVVTELRAVIAAGRRPC